MKTKLTMRSNIAEALYHITYVFCHLHNFSLLELAPASGFLQNNEQQTIITLAKYIYIECLRLTAIQETVSRCSSNTINPDFEVLMVLLVCRSGFNGKSKASIPFQELPNCPLKNKFLLCSWALEVLQQ